MSLNGFKKWDKTPNTIYQKGHLYHQDLYFNTNNVDKNRKIRVYLPSSYDFDNPNKRFPVIYMMDGKNLFDDYTSFVGEWQMDEIVEMAIKHKLTDGIIVVGIDAPKDGGDRALEMTPPELSFLRRNLRKDQINAAGYADILGDFIFKEVKPLIDKTFYTLSDKNHTGVGGSSMGGLMAFYLATTYAKYIGYALCYSPAFFLYKKKDYFEYLGKHVSLENDLPKIELYVGGEGFEHIFIERTLQTYNYFLEKGFTDKDIRYVFNEKEQHNEQAWRKYVPDTLSFFNYLK